MSPSSTGPRAPTPDDDAALDALAQGLPPLRVPPELLARTRAAMAAELAGATPGDTPLAAPSAVELRDEAQPAAEVVPLVPREATAPRAPRRIGWTLPALAALAAGALVFLALPSGPGPAPADRLVERGSGERLPDVALKVAVRRDGATRRHDPSRAVGAGDELYFRAGLDQDARLQLVRVDARGAAVVHAQGATAGEADLALDGAPLAWAVEPGEGAAVFAVLASGADLDAATVEGALGAAYDPADPDAACRAALSLGARCDATTVMVSP